ncbi:hypothetical protein HDIA_2286 [Hartmannibacter diazotrophicus]|uniref:Uncharacterized protein n=1 Tax=Hartmannibacter diazotrophicus TaxID=1482074 RepID=A0A2C9D691_9HYPH|nr:hypothetical protein [Hartmannibacter diazotrophicus]SON55827.1 hypothetical protein HDIA_2286 [Hartmannibacter diazotrophicus]
MIDDPEDVPAGEETIAGEDLTLPPVKRPPPPDHKFAKAAKVRIPDYQAKGEIKALGRLPDGTPTYAVYYVTDTGHAEASWVDEHMLEPE